MNEQVVTLDIHDEVVRSPEPWEPLSKVIWLASQLQPIQTLLLVTSFEPVLLIRILGSMGFSHESELTYGGAWNVSLHRSAASIGVEPDAVFAQPVQSDSPRVIDVDVRGLTPAPPLVKIVGVLMRMTGRVKLRVLSAERLEELHCCPELGGLITESVTRADGSHVTHIKNPAA
jgi:hypothetical protein